VTSGNQAGTEQRALKTITWEKWSIFLPLSNQLQSAVAITAAVFIEIGPRSGLSFDEYLANRLPFRAF
jgi:hypothetical protein